MTRQRLAQLRNIKAGMCQYHATRTAGSRWHMCEECFAKQSAARASKKPYKPRPLKVDWTRVDWTLPVRQIARDMGVSSAAVYHHMPRAADSIARVRRTVARLQPCDYTHMIEALQKAVAVTK